ncbi:GNAT family N-acetyltransferase [Actinopolymorpha rutila]|uniref:GNAT superfamily N-acetyltransferase n=1 Tax=Actinopolymorpha rutila TaxID=446787 RepID=A0A852ZHV3_9ACTN|nr:GNAT family N-acetyltransferase [Actinopolymorpha rutila]NYH89189.1 GNAT superfamily N-acetyltransferase [Actinopolymorpha rutila]
MPTWTINPESVDGSWVDEAIREYFTEVGARILGRPATDDELRTALVDDPHHDLRPPHGEFLVARDEGGALLGYAGVRLLPAVPGAAELKRMYVRPAGRGAGVGRGLLLAVETTARRLGAARIVLETNDELSEARSLYEARGYHETVPYQASHDGADHWYAKPLAADPG